MATSQDLDTLSGLVGPLEPLGLPENLNRTDAEDREQRDVQRGMAPKPLPSIERLRQLFCLDAATGVLTWRRRPCSEFQTPRAWSIWSARFPERPAGAKDSRGYVRIMVDGHLRLAHRIVFALANGRDPGKDFIDHRDAAPSNNRPSNLRLATRSQNSLNRRAARTNTTGCKGVSFDKSKGCYGAEIQVAGKRFKLGCHPTPEVAAAAYGRAALELAGEFARADAPPFEPTSLTNSKTATASATTLNPDKASVMIDQPPAKRPDARLASEGGD